MEQLAHAIRQMINVSDAEMQTFLQGCRHQAYRAKETLSPTGSIPNEIYFICKGLIRVFIVDGEGREHSMHFALENQFIADYSAFILQVPAINALQALEPTEVVVIPRAAVEWGYAHMVQGDRLGRLIAEYYFVYQDHRIRNVYARSPKERYDSITEVFPNIHNRVPQHMIASYLGITPVHLSRLKRQDSLKT